MWSSIESLKQNLNKIALDVHDEDDDEVLGIHASSNGHDSSFSDRRNSHSFAHSNSASRSPLPNGIDSPYNPEIEQCKAEIRRLRESESEIKALSVNYAALLKEKEDQITRLNQENSSLRRNLDSTREALSSSRSENSRMLTNSIHPVKGSGDQSPNRQHRSSAQVKNRFAGNQMQNGKQDGASNGIAHAGEFDTMDSRMELKSSHVKEKELADMVGKKNKSLEELQVAHELRIKQLMSELEQEHDQVAKAQLKIQEERKLKESLQEEVKMLKMVESKTSLELNEMRSELNDKISEIRRLQMELGKKEDDDVDHSVKGLKRVIAALEKENTSLKNELEATLESVRTSHVKSSPDQKVDSSGKFPGKEELELSLQKLEKDLKETRQERDKALQQLTRLKQHLLEKESEESEKMDEDSKIIEELRANNEYQRAQILKLEKALKQAIAYQEEIKAKNHNEIQNSKEIIEDLNKKLANCMNTIDSKNVELLNLQTALGQYFAEMEAKEHLERNLASAKEEIAKLSELLKCAEQGTETLRREKEEILAKLSQGERTVAEWKYRFNKLEEDNAKLRGVLEQSMTRLNRMSVDSDYLVDRRIVIKLLVTYFQRNHSKEVLDLMVRMLGFSDEDKQRIGFAQQGGRGVVRGVLGLPGRLVGGILGGNSAEVQATSENQSFADLWVDFLLKETEEREKRSSVEDTSKPEEDSNGKSPVSGSVPPPPLPGPTSGFHRAAFLAAPSYSPLPYQGNSRQHPGSEFSAVPLTSSDRMSRLLNR